MFLYSVGRGSSRCERRVMCRAALVRSVFGRCEAPSIWHVIDHCHFSWCNNCTHFYPSRHEPQTRWVNYAWAHYSSVIISERSWLSHLLLPPSPPLWPSLTCFSDVYHCQMGWLWAQDIRVTGCWSNGRQIFFSFFFFPTCSRLGSFSDILFFLRLLFLCADFSKCCLFFWWFSCFVDGYPPIAAASMWTRKDLKEFKDSLRKDPDSVIKVGSGETVTVSSPLLSLALSSCFHIHPSLPPILLFIFWAV